MNKHFGYYHISIQGSSSRALFGSNNERAFVLSFLQQTLSMRTIIESPLGYRTLATHIDLLAFSLTRSSCQLVLFGISLRSVKILCAQLCQELQGYQASYGITTQPTRTSISSLAGPHTALQQSITIHQQHEDWENDRYSSIGFYLHDRRGDWMRLWRVSQLYECDPEKYRALCEASRLYVTPQGSIAPEVLQAISS